MTGARESTAATAWRHAAGRIAAVAGVLAAATGCPRGVAPASSPGAERILRCDLLRNGDFERRTPSGIEGGFWIGAFPERSHPGTTVEDGAGHGGGRALRLDGTRGGSAAQPFPAYAPLASGVRIRLRIRWDPASLPPADAPVPRLDVVLRDGSDREARLGLTPRRGSAEVPLERRIPPDGAWHDVTWDAGKRFLALHGKPPLPRLRLEFQAKGGVVFLDDVAAEVPLPLPDPTDLRREILDDLRPILGRFCELGVDRTGRPTGFLTHSFDVVTGRGILSPRTHRLAASPSSAHPLFLVLLDYLRLEDHPPFRAAVQRFAEDFLSLGFDPSTGLPAAWDGERDERVDAPFEVAIPIRRLLELHRVTGDERFLRAADRVGQAVLRGGLLPDGTIAPRYVPSTGRPDRQVLHVRELDPVEALARLWHATGNEAYRRAVHRAGEALRRRLVWEGDPEAFEPGFDDVLGNLGVRAWEIQELTGDPLFRDIALEGAQAYFDAWAEVMLRGKGTAGDDVRTWGLYLAIARDDPSHRAAYGSRIRLALANHLAGQQYPNGSWGDVTFLAFEPRLNLPVGDTTGVPFNLIGGFAKAFDPLVEGPTPSLRAAFTAVVRSSRDAYRRRYGYLATHLEAATNPAGRSLGYLGALLQALQAMESWCETPSLPASPPGDPSISRTRARGPSGLPGGRRGEPGF